MAKVTNLNQFRKAKARAEKSRQAEENRARFGRTKTDKLLDRARKARDDEHLDGHRLGKDDD